MPSSYHKAKKDSRNIIAVSSIIVVIAGSFLLFLVPALPLPVVSAFSTSRPQQQRLPFGIIANNINPHQRTTNFHPLNMSTEASSPSQKKHKTARPPLERRSTTSSSFLDDVPMGPPDPILGIADAYRKCTDPNKVNICVGAFRDADGKPWVLPSVRAAEERMLSNNVNKEYAPIQGDDEFINYAITFAYGTEIMKNEDTSIAAIQSLSGTGACKIAGLFYAKFLPVGTKIYIPDPTWGNHIPIFKNCGLDVQRYRYYDYKTNSLDYEGMMEDIKSAPSGSIILLHACAHNPTGVDPSPDQWSELSQTILDQDCLVLFDSAYQGFATGDAEHDASALRLFVNDGHMCSLAQSFAKNFGLYGERCGTLSFVCPNDDAKEKVMSQLKLIVRPMYSNPPIHGGNIVKTVLKCPDLKKQYYEECSSMASRIRDMRTLLVTKLGEVGSSHDWSHVTNQIGMFAYTGMNADMCTELTEKYSIFLTKDGRISLAGLTEDNIEYVAKAVHDVTDGKSIVRE